MTTIAAGIGPIEHAARIGAEVAALHAAEVDRLARFPYEAVDALKEARLLSAYVPKEYGGGGANILQLGAACEQLARHCSATAMVFAMHQIQVACLVRHAEGQPFFEKYLRDLVDHQYLIASVTSEMGIGGEMRTSKCALERSDAYFSLSKDASTISYGAQADHLLVTSRSGPDAPANDQALTLLLSDDFTLEQAGEWDTLGMRGTCSPPFRLTSSGNAEQVMPVAFGEIASHTMVPFSHVLWANCWLGIAAGAAAKARAFVRKQARSNPGSVPPAATRVADVVARLQVVRANVHDVATECDGLISAPGAATDVLSSIAFGLKMNNLKVTTSTAVAEIVQACLGICGIMGYKNDSPYSIGRELRDSLSAALMVSNERILATNASMLLVLKDD